MIKISDDLDVATDGTCDSLYKLLKVNERETTATILPKATAKAKEINDITKKDIKANALNRLSGKFMLIFKNDKERNSYDVAVKRFRFDKYARTALTHYVEGWCTKKKTDWKLYHDRIDDVKKLGYTQEEAAWLVYEYFCLTRKCPVPEKPKKGIGWGKHEPLRGHLIFLFQQSIEYHNDSIKHGANPKMKNKLQSVIEQFNEITDPDNVVSTVGKIINEDLRKFWDSCKYDGSASIPLIQPTAWSDFKRTVLPRYPKLEDFLHLSVFTRNN
jgi:hypothetical protein